MRQYQLSLLFSSNDHWWSRGDCSKKKKKGRTASFASRTTFSLTFCKRRESRTNWFYFRKWCICRIYEIGITIETLVFDATRSQESGVWHVWPGLNNISMAVFAIDSPSLTRSTRKRKSEKLQFASFLIAERTVEIFAFKDSGHFRIFAEKSRDPKTRRFSSEVYFLLRERDTVADPCCELNVGNGRLKGCEWSDEEKNLVYEGWRNSGTSQIC